jgi:hypothetical protein
VIFVWDQVAKEWGLGTISVRPMQKLDGPAGLRLAESS